MPIFMDRHDLSGATATNVADAHRKDLEIQDRYGVKFLTYWFDQRRGTAFCLIDAPDKNTAHCVHCEAHGLVASDIVEVALSAVEAFLGRIQDPVPPPGQSRSDPDSGHRAIHVHRHCRLDDDDRTPWRSLVYGKIRAHDAIVRRCLNRDGGREVKHTGDGVRPPLTPQRRPWNAQRQSRWNSSATTIGIWEPSTFGSASTAGSPSRTVAICSALQSSLPARLCAIALPDHILVSENIRKEHGGAFVKLRAKRLKGFSRPVPLYAWVWNGREADITKPAAQKPGGAH